MDILYRNDQLLEEPSRFTLSEASFSYYILKHITSSRIFHGNAQVVGSKENLFKLDNMGVYKLPVVENLSLNVFGDLVATFYEFNSDLSTGGFVESKLNKAKRA